MQRYYFCIIKWKIIVLIPRKKKVDMSPATRLDYFLKEWARLDSKYVQPYDIWIIKKKNLWFINKYNSIYIPLVIIAHQLYENCIIIHGISWSSYNFWTIGYIIYTGPLSSVHLIEFFQVAKLTYHILTKKKKKEKAYIPYA